jgi:outer membrane protein assembly factor BamB
VVFAGSADYTVRAFGIGSGDEAWRHEGRAPVTAMALSDGDTGGDGAALYVGTDEGEIRAHAADTGVVDWTGEFGEAGNPIEWLATQNRRLYVGGHFGVEAYGTGGDGQ